MRGGIWQITKELGRINTELGVTTHLSSEVLHIDTDNRMIDHELEGRERRISYDHLLLATDPVTAARIVGDPSTIRLANNERTLGSAGKLNLMFKNPVRWKHGYRSRQTGSCRALEASFRDCRGPVFMGT